MSILAAILTIPLRILELLPHAIGWLAWAALLVFVLWLAFLILRTVYRWSLPLLGGGVTVGVGCGLALTESPWLWGGAVFAVLAGVKLFLRWKQMEWDR